MRIIGTMNKIVVIANALGDESRMRILLCLMDSTLCPCHLSEILGRAGTTVSKHLGVLESAGLIVSQPEGKLNYYRWADGGDGSCVAEALAWVRWHAESDGQTKDDAAKRSVVLARLNVPCPPEARTRVMFLCTGNSCRSQMAEGLLRAMAGQHFAVYSAGLEPRPIAAMTYQVMQEIGVDINGQRPKSLKDFLGREHFGHLITVCDKAESACPVFPGVSNRQHWPLNDLSKVEGPEEEQLAAFRETRDKLIAKISVWLKERGLRMLRWCQIPDVILIARRRCAENDRESPLRRLSILFLFLGTSIRRR